MRNLRSILVITALAGIGCGGNWSDEDLRFYGSIPDRTTLESKLTGDTGGTGQQALVGEASALFLDTQTQSRNFNAGVFGLLQGFERITRRPPSTRAPDLRVWGPALHWGSRQHQIRLVVRWNEADGRFEHALQARRLGETDLDWVPVIAGAFVPGSEQSRIHSGAGGLTLSVDALRTVGLPVGALDAVSQIDMGYDTSGWPVWVGVAVIPVSAATGELRYGYLEGEDGQGILRFVLEKNHVPGPGLETLVVASAWRPDHAGRANVLVAGGDLAGPVTHEECWDAAGTILYERNWAGAEDGRRLDCPGIAPPEPIEP